MPLDQEGDDEPDGNRPIDQFQGVEIDTLPDLDAVILRGRDEELRQLEAIISELERIGREALQKGEVGVVVLNGGMATRFGGVVKGVVPVLGKDRSFLGLVLEDVKKAEARAGGKVPVFLMNSFATAESWFTDEKELIVSMKPYSGNIRGGAVG